MLLGLQSVSLRVLQHESWLKSEMRVRINGHKVQQYAAEKKHGANFPAPIVFVDPDDIYWTGDGFHRIAAESLNDKKEMQVYLKTGTINDAILCNLRGNRESHGLPFSAGDITKACKYFLTSPEFKNWTRTKMAEVIGCTPSMISRVAIDKLGQPKKGKGCGKSVPTEEVVRLLAAGKSKAEIAEELGVALRTVYREDVRSHFMDCPTCKGTGRVLKEETA